MTDAYLLSDAANVIGDQAAADPHGNYQPTAAVLVWAPGQDSPRAVIDPATDPRQIPEERAQTQVAPALTAAPEAAAVEPAVEAEVAPDPGVPQPVPPEG